MSRRARIVAAVVSAALLGASGTWPAEADRSVSADRQAYIAAPEVVADCSSQQGAACFRIPTGQRRVQILVSDDMGRRPIAATFEFRSAAGVITRHAFCDGTAPDVPATATELRVYVATIDPVGCAAGPSTATTGAVEVTWIDNNARIPAIDAEPQSCLGAPPSAVDTGPTEQLTLRALILLDGVSRQRADELTDVAARVFAAAGIRLDLRYRPVTLPAGDQQQLLGYAKAVLGGQRPAGTDVVHLLTSKQYGRTGVADCIGGIAFPTRAFSLSMDFPDKPTWCYVGQVVCMGSLTDFAGKVVAHEIGHVVGGQHQLSSYECTAAVNTANGGCVTIMDGQPLVPYGEVFSTTNRALLRGHVRDFAGR